MADNPTYSKRTIEIADYIFANPMAKRMDVLAKFGKKWQIPNRTFDRMLKKAKEYNLTRLQKQERAKEYVLVSHAKTTAENDLIRRKKYIGILDNIAEKSKTDGDRIRAIQQLSKMEGWDAPVKTAQTDSQGNDTGTEITVTVLQTPYKLASDENELDI
jgi:hypothetical protein